MCVGLLDHSGHFPPTTNLYYLAQVEGEMEALYSSHADKVMAASREKPSGGTRGGGRGEQRTEAKK